PWAADLRRTQQAGPGAAVRADALAGGPDEMHCRRAVFAAVVQGETGRQVQLGVAALFEDDGCVRRQPAALARRDQRLLAETPAVGRIEEDEVEGTHGAGGTEGGGVAAEELGDTADA